MKDWSWAGHGWVGDRAQLIGRSHGQVMLVRGYPNVA